MFKSENVYIRRLEKTDLRQTLKWINEPELMTIMGFKGPKNKAEQDEWFLELNKYDTKVVFAICLNKGNKHIGNVSLYSIDLINRNAGLSVFIADQNNRHKGYGTEALKLLLDYAFNHINLIRVYLKTSADYTGAVKMYQSLGFKKEGIMRCHEFRNGEYINKIIFGLLKDEYIP